MRPKSKLGLALWMGLRYVRSRNRGVSRSINWVSFGGIVLGITLLLVVVAVQNGLFRDAERRVLDVVPHVTVPSESASPGYIKSLRESNRVVSVVRFAQLSALLTVEGYTTSVVVYAVDSSTEFDAMTSRHSRAQQENGAALNPHSIPLGSIVSGESFGLTFPVVIDNGLKVERRWFRWTADVTNNAGLEFPLVVVHVSDLVQSGVLDPDQIDWRVTLNNPWEADAMFADIPRALTWSQVHAEYFRALGLEKTITFVLLTFVIALASLNIVSGQAMLINSKKTDIAILRTLGADRMVLNLAFAMHGLIIVVAGISVGVLVGMAITETFEYMRDTFFSVFRPTLDVGSLRSVSPFLRTSDVVTTVSVSFAIACLGVLRPLALVLKTNPIDALHSPA